MSTFLTRTSTRRLGSGVLALGAAGLIISGCSTADDNASSASSAQSASAADSSAAPATHNDADVSFNTMMIPHHRQAVEMVDLVDGRTTNAELIALANQIKAAQQPEIDQMTARLKAWGKPVEEGGGHGGHGGHGAAPMEGMMTGAQMAAMRNAKGAEFDRLWLTGMIAHHQGAVTMSDTELADGADAPSRKLATQIKASQQKEIEQMKRMLGQR